MTRNITVTLLVASILFSSAITVSASSVSQAYQIDELHTFYVLTISTNPSNNSIYFPTLAERMTNRISSSSIGYSIRTPEGLRVKDGVTAALLKSPHEMKDGAYITGHHATGTLSLYVLHRKATTTSRANTLTIDDFPFYLERKNGTKNQNRLYPSELQRLTISATGTPEKIDSE